MSIVVNVILHGVYGYIFRANYIEVYTPAVDGHIYAAGGLDYKAAASEGPLRKLVEYSLKGVLGDSSDRKKPDGRYHPLLPLSKDDDRIDTYGKRYCTFRLPYPKKIEGRETKQFWALDAYEVGAIYGGRDATPLNDMEMCPSVLALVYPGEKRDLKLDPDDGGAAIDLSKLPENEGGGGVNVHIWCTIDPDDMSLHGMSPDGHIRRAFAALVDLFPTLEVTLQIPDKFSPTPCDEVLPPGVTRCDVDPGRKGCKKVDFGKVNCHYSMLMFWPSE